MEFLDQISLMTNEASAQFNPLVAWGLKILLAIVILVVGYFLAKIISKVIGAAIDKIGFVDRANRETGTDQPNIGSSIATAIFWLLMLVVFAVALATLGLSEVVAPVQGMWTEILTFLPQLIAAIAILGLGLIFAVIVRRMVQSVLLAARIDQMVSSAGSHMPEVGTTQDTATTTSTPVATGPKAPRLSSALSWIVFALIAIPVVIAAVDALGIDAISDPTTTMLNEVLLALPNIFVAGIILVIAYFIAKFVTMLIEQVLPQFGIDRYMQKIGLTEATEGSFTATKAISTIVGIAIMLFGAVEATEVLGFAVLSDFVEIILEQGAEILFGIVIILVGIVLANAAGKVLDAAGSGATDLVAKIVKYTILVLAVILGLSRMGLDPSDGIFILNVAEYIVIGFVIAFGVGGAIAFGLGGREWAARQLEKINFNRRQP